MKAGDFEAGVLKGLGDLAGGMTLLAAVSGGADSSAMLAALSRLREAGGFALRVAHVEHGIRPAGESRGDARAVKALCAGLGLPCRVLIIPRGAVARYALRRGTGIEAAARRFRYRLLREEAARHGAGAIVTAHTGDDALELCLMRILRGSGPAGLRRMPFRREFFESRRDFRESTARPGRLVLLRPLLAFSRADVEAYLMTRGISWRDDATNADERFLRNRIRHSLAPLLNEKFPGWKRGLEALGATQALAADFIEAEARRRLVWSWTDPRRPETSSGRGEGFPGGGDFSSGGELRCPAERFWGEAPILREEALFQGIGMFTSRNGGRAIAVKRRNLRRFAAGELANLDIGPCVIAVKGTPPSGYIVIFQRKPAVEAGFSLLIKEPGLYKLGYGCNFKSTIGGTALLRVSGRGEFLSGRGAGEQRGFFALLPFVLRPARNGDVIPDAGKRFTLKDSAPGGNAAPLNPVPGFRERRGFGNGVVYAVQDAAGLAALIARYPGGAVIPCRREIPPCGELFFCDIGGVDV
ncbi:MAG: tRNA lysidine(34) synthetase TilS [Treponema sp.]|nr:tRNA lysidine(34) synthetase TilS [Treponema sp.]